MIAWAFDWVVNEGWDGFARRYDMDFKDAHEFRQRHLILALSRRAF